MKDLVIRFLRETIIGKTLFADDIIYKLGEGRMEGVYSDQMMFSEFSGNRKRHSTPDAWLATS